MPSESGNDTTQERTFGTVQLWAEKRRIINQAAKGFEADLRGGRVAEVYFPRLNVRSPAAFLDDSIFSPPLLPRMLTKPRTVCACQFVIVMASARVAPLALHQRVHFGFLVGAICLRFAGFEVQCLFTKNAQDITPKNGSSKYSAG
jgi:hypothetical protein